jgi:hypothetical protein
MTKPFIAARIPQAVEDKLNEYSVQHRMGKTEILINALAQYLGCSIDAPIETKAIDRLIELEKRVALLEKGSGPPVQKHLFDNDAVINSDNKKNAQKQSDFKSDENLDNKIDDGTENIMELTTPEVIQLINIERQTLNYRAKRGNLPFTANGYTVIEKGGYGHSINGKKTTLWRVRKNDT